MSFTEDHCRRLRLLVQDCLAKHLYSSAVFYADKLVTLSGSDPGDVYMLAQVRMCLFPHKSPTCASTTVSGSIAASLHPQTARHRATSMSA